MLKHRNSNLIKISTIILFIATLSAIIINVITLNISYAYNYLQPDAQLVSKWTLIDKWNSSDNKLTHVQLFLGSDNNFALFNGCDTYLHGDYQIISNNKIIFSKQTDRIIPPSTLINYCPDGIDDYNFQAFDLFQKQFSLEHTYYINGNTLIIRLSDNNKLHFVKSDDFAQTNNWVKIYTKLFDNNS